MVVPMDVTRVQEYETLAGKLFLDLDVEKSRENHYKAILRTHGKVIPSQMYDKNSFGAHTPMVRCYDTAFSLAKEHGLTYCEGLVSFRTENDTLITMGHGFCVDSDGYVVDKTLGPIQHHKAVSYIGIGFEIGYVLKERELNGFVGVMDGNPNRPNTGVHFDNPELWLEKGWK